MRTKKDKLSLLGHYMFFAFIFINILNLLDIYTTKIATNDYTDLDVEENDWFSYNVQGGYLHAFNRMKIGIVLLESSYIFLIYSITYIKDIIKGRYILRAISVAGMTYLLFFYIEVIINNVSYIIEADLFHSLYL